METGKNGVTLDKIMVLDEIGSSSLSLPLPSPTPRPELRNSGVSTKFLRPLLTKGSFGSLERAV